MVSFGDLKSGTAWQVGAHSVRLSVRLSKRQEPFRVEMSRVE